MCVSSPRRAAVSSPRRAAVCVWLLLNCEVLGSNIAATRELCPVAPCGGQQSSDNFDASRECQALLLAQHCVLSALRVVAMRCYLSGLRLNIWCGVLMDGPQQAHGCGGAADVVSMPIARMHTQMNIVDSVV
jgi:hypothetical protein